jgi:hypothetical protein
MFFRKLFRKTGLPLIGIKREQKALFCESSKSISSNLKKADGQAEKNAEYIEWICIFYEYKCRMSLFCLKNNAKEKKVV